VFGVKLEVVSRARRIHRGARRTQSHTKVKVFNGRDALGLAHGVNPQRAEIVPNFLKFLVKPLKLTGRLYITACSSNFMNDMVVLGCV